MRPGAVEPSEWRAVRGPWPAGGPNINWKRRLAVSCATVATAVRRGHAPAAGAAASDPGSPDGERQMGHRQVTQGTDFIIERSEDVTGAQRRTLN